MREPAYAAKREVERLRQEVVRLRTQVASTLAVARSLVTANAADAGARGLEVQRALESGAAAWHMEQWRDAVAAGEEERAALHRLAVEHLDPRPYEAELSGERDVTFVTTDPPADAWLFRYAREADVLERGGPRLLPLPVATAPGPDRDVAVIPAAYSVDVGARLGGEGRRAVAPDVPSISPRLVSTEAFVESLGGRLRRDRYEALLQASSYPLETSGTNALGRLDEPRRLRLPPGRYLLLLRPEHRAEQRVPFVVARDAPTKVGVTGPLDLVRAPDGFVPVAATRRGETPFLAARFEVTYADYWAFLNDPRTIAELEAHRARELRFVPRSEGSFADPAEGALPYRPPGAPGYPPMDNPEHALAHVCLYDLVGYLTPPEGEDEPRDEQYSALAEALRASRTVGWGYLAWRTERSRRNAEEAALTGAWLPDVALLAGADGTVRPRALRFTLPTEREWVRMAGGDDGRVFAYADEREWTCFKGARSRPYNPAPEAVGLFPEDESPFGVRDLTGSVSEWTADWVESGGVFRVKGSSWGSQDIDDDRIDARRTLAPSRASSTVGVRLVVRVVE
jgi:formylglycine-generating enzyme required for sulfatase activity